MRDTKQISILSEFLRNKIKSNGLTKRKFAEKTGLNETYSYKLLSALRLFIPNDETLIKIADVLELTSKERNYIFNIVKHERESKEHIYSSKLLIEPVLKTSDISLPESNLASQESLPDKFLSETVSLPGEPLLKQSSFEPPSIEVTPVISPLRKILIPEQFVKNPPGRGKIEETIGYYKKIGEPEKISILSIFFKNKVKDKGWKKREFAKKTGLNETYVYKLLSGLRCFIPNDETLIKIANILELTSEERNYIFDVVRCEREIGERIYSFESIIETVPKASEVCLPEPVLLSSEPSSIEIEPVICSSNILEEEKGLFPLNEILIPEQFIKTPPGRGKIEETIGYYKKHGKFDKPIKVNRNTMMLTDGYKRYVAAKELKLTEVQVQFIGREKQGSTIKKQVVEEPTSKKPVLEVIEELPHKKPVLVEGEEFCLLSEIIIPKTFHFPPGKKTIGKAINFYRQHGKFPNSIKINKENKNLIEGYKYYMAAKELGLIEIGVKFIEKEEAKPSDKSMDKEKTKPFDSDFCQLSEIIIPEQFIKLLPEKEKIEEIVSSYRKHGKFDNPLKVIRQIILVDGYKSYIAAKELGLTEIEVKFISIPVQEIIKLLTKEEKEKKDIPVLVKKKIKTAISIVAKNLKGSIKKIVSGKGYGFINGDDREVYFFHQSGLRNMDIDELDLEYRVTFDLIEGLKGSQAVNIKQDFC